MQVRAASSRTNGGDEHKCEMCGLRFAPDLGFRRRNGPVTRTTAIRIIALRRARSLALEDSRMDAFAVTAFA